MTTLKTIKLKRAPSAEPMQAAPPPIASADAAPSVSIPPPPPGLEPVSSKPKVSGKSYMIFAIFAIVATLFCLAIIGMQYTELSFYKADPSVWPVK